MALTDGKGLTQAPAFGTPEYTTWYYNDPAGPGYNPATVSAAPAFGTPAYTEWYYNNPAGPGYNPNGKVVKVESNTGIVKVVDTSTGSEVVTGIVKPIDLEQSKAAANQVTKPEIIEVQDPAKIQVIQQAVQDLKPYEVKPGLYDINQYLIDNINNPGKAFNNLYNAGFSREAVSKAAHENLDAANKKNNEAQRSLASKVWQGMTPWDESKGETATAGGVGTMAAELVVPGVYTVRHWNDMSGGEKAFSIVMDVATLIPVAGAAAKGAKTVSTAGRAARIAGAAKGIGSEAIAQLRAPVDMVIHPIGTAKGAVKQGRELVENIAHPNKIPEAVITTSDSTVRLKVSETTSPAQAMAIRDKLMDLVSKGERPMIEIDGQVVELGQSPLMKEVGGGVVHTTPQGEAFTNGLKVMEKTNPTTGAIMPASEQGLFVANQPLPRFVGSSAFGGTGEKPAILIFSKDIAKKAIPSGKIYESPVGKVSEMELKFPVGTELPAPKQKLFTRVGPLNQRVEIYLDKPLSRIQIAKLKGTAIVEDLKAPFKPAIDISNTGPISAASDADVGDMIDALKRSGNTDQAAALRQARAITRSQRLVPRSLEDVVGRPDPTEVDAERSKLDQGTAPARSQDTTRAADQAVETRTEPARTEDWDRSDPFDDRNSYDPYADEPARTEAPARESTRSETPRNEETRTEPARAEDQRREIPRQAEQRRGEARTAEQRPDQSRPPEPPRPPGERPPTRRPPDPERIINRPPDQPRPPEPPRGSERGGQVRESGKDKTPRPPRTGLPGKNEQAGERTFNKGTVAWKQGIGWWVWKPPYRNQDREFVFAKPTGAEITADARTAFGTVQAIGGSGAVNKGFDMGIVDVELNKAPSTPSRSAGHKELKFKRNMDHVRASKGTKPANGRKMGPYYYKNGALAKKPLA